MAGLRHGAKRYCLGRDATQRWHLQRTQVTQLVEHERIHTTYAKAKALQYLALRAFKIGKKAALNKGNNINKLMGILTTRMAVKKMINEIVPKFKDPSENIVKVVETPMRKSDTARMAYIEYNKNDLKKYEEAAHREKLEKGQIVNISQFNKRILKEEYDFLLARRVAAEERLESARLQGETEVELKRCEQDVKFFERKIATVERELWIENKNPLDVRRYFRIY